LAQPNINKDPAGLPFVVSRSPVKPCPAEAVAVRTSLAWVVGVGGVVSVMGMVHMASVTPQIPVPAEAALSVRLAVAVCPVSMPLTNRLLTVFV
jgi:hypothetical protein